MQLPSLVRGFFLHPATKRSSPTSRPFADLRGERPPSTKALNRPPEHKGDARALLPLTIRGLRLAPWSARDRNDFFAAGQDAASVTRSPGDLLGVPDPG